VNSSIMKARRKPLRPNNWTRFGVTVSALPTSVVSLPTKFPTLYRIASLPKVQPWHRLTFRRCELLPRDNEARGDHAVDLRSEYSARNVLVEPLAVVVKERRVTYCERFVEFGHV
jgi:hypothetical protein